MIEELIGTQIRLESPGCVVREQGQRHGDLHGGGPKQIDPIFGYRTQNGKIHAGMVRVIFELSEIQQGDGGTHFLAGSHKAAFPMDPVSTAMRFQLIGQNRPIFRPILDLFLTD